VSASSDERFADVLGPILVKELRQGLRARAFTIFFGLLLLACLVISMIAVGQAAQLKRDLGPKVLLGYLTALAAVTFFVIPFGAFRSLLREREEETWSLLALTGLGGRAIVRGKWVSAMAQGALFASACAPFVLFSYFLNGVSLVQVVLPLAASLVWSGFVTTLALALASQAASSAGRTASQLSAVVLLAFAALLGFGYLSVLATDGGISGGREPEFLQVSAVLCLVALGTSQLALEGAAAGLALPTEAASRGPRQALLTFVCAMMLAALPAFWLLRPGPRAAVVSGVFSALYLVIAGFFAVGEGDGWPRRFAGDGWLKPGALRSYLLVLALLGVTGAGWLLLFFASGGGDRYQAALVCAPCYPLLYLSLGVIAGRLTPLRTLGEPRASRVAFSVLTALGIASSLVVGLLTHRVNSRPLHCLNPVFGLVQLLDHPNDPALERPEVLALLGATGLAVAIAIAVLRARDLEREV
jgi:ABC-type transport system involved in multi-copper enzyme maturation permease subunit